MRSTQRRRVAEDRREFKMNLIPFSASLRLCVETFSARSYADYERRGGEMAQTTQYAMYETMHRQPADLRVLLTRGWEGAAAAAERLAGAARVFVVGIGSSYHAAQAGE